MGVFNSVIMESSQAFKKIPALINQAKSYSTHPRMVAARQTASRLANSSWTGARGLGASAYGNSMRMRAGIGAVGGAAAGAGYDAYSDNRSDWRSQLSAGVKGGILGGLAGASSALIGPGRSAVKSSMPSIRGGISSGMGSMRSTASDLASRAKVGYGNRVARAQYRQGFGY